MRALKLIIQREYLSRIQKKSFLIMTILMPVIFIALIFVPIWLAGIKDSQAKQIAIIDSTGKYADHLKSNEEYVFNITDRNPGKLKTDGESELFGVLQITDDLGNNPKAVTLYSEKQAPIGLLDYINSTLSEVTKSEKLNNLSKRDNIDPEVLTEIRNISQSKNDINITTMRWDEDGAEKETSTIISSAIGGIITFLMYMFILMYGTMVMNGVVEEKSNRIVEVMISSVKPFDLMMGKIIGIGLVGITQLLIWIVLIGGVLASAGTLFPQSGMEDAGSPLDVNLLLSVNWIEIVICFLLFFIGGYLIYASIFSIIGAAVDNAQDTQQFVLPVTLIFVFALYAGIYSIQNPDGPLAFWCSLIPLTSPIVMMVRIPFGVPIWQVLLSIAILYISIVLVVKFAAKIYRVGILMYGKKPNIKEVIKWFSYK